MATPKAVDSKGRISLGARWAGRHALVEKISDTEVRVIMARVVPECEAWLHENERAKAMVDAGLAAARDGDLAEEPDLDAIDTEDDGGS